MCPKLAGLIEESAHLSRHVPKSGGCTEDDRVGRCEHGRFSDWDMSKGFAHFGGTHFLENVGRECLFHLDDLGCSTRDALNPLSDGESKLVDVTVETVEND